MFAAGLLVLAGVMSYQLIADHRAVTERENHRLQTQTRVIALNIERQLEAANLALSSVVRDLGYLRDYSDTEMTNHHLQALSDALPGVRTMFILDTEGTIVAANREGLIGKNFRTRDYFATPSKDNHPERLYLSPPFRTVLGSFLIHLSRVVPLPDGSFGGIVTSGLDPDYFRVLLDSVLYAPDMASTIIHGDGTRFMMIPDPNGQSGQDTRESETCYSRHLKSGLPENVLVVNPTGHGSDRVVAIRTVQPRQLLPDKALYVACSRDRTAIYENWRDALYKQMLAFVLIGLSAGVALTALQRRQRALAKVVIRSHDLIRMRLELMEHAVTHDLPDLLRRTVDEVCRLSESPVGFYHFVEPDQKSIALQVWSTRTLAEFCTANGHGLHYPIERAGVWADCVRLKKPVIHNDYASLPNRKGLPDGHAEVVRELVVPIFRNEKVVAILGVGNKTTDYTEEDVDLLTYLADVAWEITERKRSEEERQRLGLRYRTLMAVAGDGIHIVDQDGNLVESNAAFRRMLGYAEEDELRLQIGEWDAEFSPEEIALNIAKVIQTPSIFETRFRRRDGSVFEVEINACGVEFNGKHYIYASTRDISRRKQMESSLRESRQFLADIFNFLPDPTFVVDRDMKVIAWNRAIEEMTGVPGNEMLGQGDYAYTIPFYGERRKQLLDLIDADAGVIETNYRNVTRMGDRLYGEAFCPALYNWKGAHVWATVAPLFDGDGKRIGAIETIRDITAIKEIEANLARSNLELEQFAYVASHDLQEPLRKITGFTELLGKRLKGTLDEKSESYMWYIVDGATRMRTLINDLLGYSRVMRSTRELEETDCSTVLSRVLRDLEPVVKECGAEIVCGPLPVVHADPVQLGQIFQNLIGNAVKYRGDSSPEIKIEAVRRRHDWLFSVADNGIGIAPEFFERVFAIFQRLHTVAEYPGTGIGLAVCRKIVERHGGKIWIESTVGAGSTFFFTLPSTSEEQETTT